MKRLSLLLVAFALLITASGCCCPLFHGCNSCCGYPSYQPACGSCGGCGYAPAYPVGPAPCPTCPGGGCGVQGPVIQQGAYIEGDTYHASAAPAAPVASPTIAAVDPLRTF